MEELKRILREQAKRYPKMQPADGVKLIYQNEFGGGHLIKDEAACMDYLRREYAQVDKDPAAPLYEEIGNDIVRVNLAAVAPENLEQLGRDFIRSAGEHKGNLERFKEKLEVLLIVAQSGAFGFAGAELQAYLETYAASGYPAVSHSQEYRDLYKPAYRVVIKKES